LQWVVKEIAETLDQIPQAWQSTSRSCNDAMPELIVQIRWSHQCLGGGQAIPWGAGLKPSVASIWP